MNTELKCRQWHDELLPEFIENITTNVKIRLDKIVCIVNHNIPTHFERFEINSTVQNDVMKKIKPQIIEKTKVEHKSCAKPLKSLKEYKIVARNRLNRNKPKFLGNYLFAEIIFNKLYPWICQQSCKHDIIMDNMSAMKLFINILIIILESPVHFTQTKPQNLILNTSLVNENLFKKALLKLLKLYKISPVTNTITNTNAKKSQQKYLKIVDAIKQINNFDILSRLPRIPSTILTITDSIPILDTPTISNTRTIISDINNTYLSAQCTIAVIYDGFHSSTHAASAQRYSPTYSPIYYNGLCYNVSHSY